MHAFALLRQHHTQICSEDLLQDMILLQRFFQCFLKFKGCKSFLETTFRRGESIKDHFVIILLTSRGG